MFFSTVVYHRILSVALSATVGPYYLSIYTVACICQSQTPNPPLIQPHPSWQPQSALYGRASVSVSYIGPFVPYS